LEPIYQRTGVGTEHTLHQIDDITAKRWPLGTAGGLQQRRPTITTCYYDGKAILNSPRDSDLNTMHEIKKKKSLKSNAEIQKTSAVASIINYKN